MQITFHGQSCFEIQEAGTKLIIDPFLKGNPLAKVQPEEIEVEYILLTHGHDDHVGDTVKIAKRTGATVIANNELAHWIGFQGVENVHPMHIGGSHLFDFGRVKLTQAFHGSAHIDSEKKEIVYLGMPAGLLLTLGGKTIYHAGDTCLFSDMKLIGEQNDIDLALLPIGDNFTMGPEDALIAAEWIGARKTVPMHYNTFPLIEQDADAFIRLLSEKQLAGQVVRPGESFKL
jgi:L-ascorbate metabolism protein UlaG (beta-lactamase superfamily)